MVKARKQLKHKDELVRDMRAEAKAHKQAATRQRQELRKQPQACAYISKLWANVAGRGVVFVGNDACRAAVAEAVNAAAVGSVPLPANKAQQPLLQLQWWRRRQRQQLEDVLAAARMSGRRRGCC